MTKLTRAQAARIAALYNNMEVRAAMARDPEWSEFMTDLWTRAVQSAQALHDEFGIRPAGWEQHIKLDPLETASTTITYVQVSGQRITKEYKSIEQAHLAAAQIGLGASAVDEVA
jgi:hypothetical protein